MNGLSLFLTILRGLEVIAGWWVIFFLLHRPKSRIRRAALLIAFPALYALWYLLPINVWFAKGTPLGAVISDDTVNELLWIVIILALTFLCGNLRRSLFGAFWYIGIEQNADVLRACINRLMNGGNYVFNYPQFNIEYLLVFIWALFYYYHRRKVSRIPPLVFQISTVAVPILSALLLTRYYAIVRMTEAGSALRTAILFDNLLFGALLLAFNLCMFHLYLKLLLKENARAFTMEISHTLPLWTQEGGLSEAFCKEKKISRRQRKIIEELLQGKTDKEIAAALGVSSNTVRNHLRNLYESTGVHGRNAFCALLR